MRALRVAITALIALVAAMPAHAVDWEPPIQDTFAIAGKAVPLPAGDWQVVARRTTPAADSPVSVALRSAVLVQRSGDRIVAAIAVHTNDAPLRRSLPVPEACKRDDIHLAVMVYETSTDASCLWINHIIEGAPSGTIDPLWAEITKTLSSSLPALWLEAGFWIGDRQDVLDIRYHFTPPEGEATRGTGWRDSAWSPGNVGETGPRSVVIGDLAAWIGSMAPLIDLGLHDRLALYQPVAMPWTGPAADTAPGKALRLRQLDTLFKAGGIGAAAYATQHDILEREATPPEFARPNIFVRAGYKTLTYRVVSSLDTFAVSWFVLGTFYSSVGMTIVSGIAHALVYYGHEVAWSMAGVRAEKAESWTVLPLGIDR